MTKTKQVRIGVDAQRRLDAFKKPGEINAEAMDRLTEILEVKCDQRNRWLGQENLRKARENVKRALKALDEAGK